MVDKRKLLCQLEGLWVVRLLEIGWKFLIETGEVEKDPLALYVNSRSGKCSKAWTYISSK